jgi:DNA-binding MarR family transcriptional regulator
MKSGRLFIYEKKVSEIVGALHRRLTRDIYDLFLKDKLSLSHIVAMEFLYDKDNSNMSELSKALTLTMGATTAVIDKLIKFGFVRRRHLEQDRRIVEVSLTAKGSTMVEGVMRHRLEMVKKVLSVLTDRDKEIYLDLLEKIHKGLITNGK